jgi:hypothetical protein
MIKSAVPTGPVRLGRRPLLIAAGLVVALGLLGGPYLYLRGAPDREVQQAVAETERQDSGWRFEDLQRQRPAIADEQNAALCVTAARMLMPESWPPRAETRPYAAMPAARRPLLTDFLARLEPQQQLNEDQARELRAQLQKLAPALAEASRLADLPAGRYPLTWDVQFITTLVPEVRKSRDVADLLHDDAALRAQDRDMAGACRSEQAALNAGRAIGDEYTVVALGMRTALAVQAVRGLERTLAQGAPAEDSLAALQNLVEREEAETPAAVVAALRGERALMHRLLAAIERGELTLPPGLVEEGPAFHESSRAALAADALRHSHAVYLRRMAENIAAARLPCPALFTRLQELDASPVDERTAALASWFLPAVARQLRTIPGTLAMLRCAAAALALERYRLAHGRWPEGLDGLTPKLLAEVPADPFDGQPLRFRRLEDGVVVYSVGPDGEDNGGRIDRRNPSASGTDLGFRLWDVERRRASAQSPIANDQRMPKPE